MNDFPTQLDQQEMLSEIRNIMIKDVGQLWIHIEHHIDIYLENQKNHLEQLINERIEGTISYELFETKLEDVQMATAIFLHQFEIIPYDIVKKTSENMALVVKQKVESHLIALLMPFTYVEPAAC
ncbi:hypothetical protein KFE94_05240 [bacterium SCSIO 12643]|nr:hypothetical protein KFE94_05240 [bacterium SCSIO 12643]